jgi:hypothetical protein
MEKRCVKSLIINELIIILYTYKSFKRFVEDKVEATNSPGNSTKHQARFNFLNLRSTMPQTLTEQLSRDPANCRPCKRLGYQTHVERYPRGYRCFAADSCAALLPTPVAGAENLELAAYRGLHQLSGRPDQVKPCRSWCQSDYLSGWQVAADNNG